MKKDKIAHVREFATALAAVLAVIALLPLIKKGHIRLWAIYASLAVLLVKFFLPGLLGPVYAVFLKVTRIIGKINSAILLSIVYYLLITPIGFIMRMSKQGILKKGPDKTAQTYWIRRDAALDNPKRMERQF